MCNQASHERVVGVGRKVVVRPSVRISTFVSYVEEPRGREQGRVKKREGRDGGRVEGDGAY